MPDLQDTITRVSGLGFDCPDNCTKRYQRYKDGAAKRGYVFELTIEQARAMFSVPCMYCHYPPRGEFNGIDRVDNSKGYTLDNCVPCCAWCNRAKSDGQLPRFMEWIWWMRPELRPKRALKAEDTPTTRVIRWHDSFVAFPPTEDVQVSIKSARKIVDITSTYR